MKKIFLLIGLTIFIVMLVSCGKKYEIDSKIKITFKTSLGDFKIGVYKSTAPKAVQWLIKFCKEKRYKDTLIDEVIFPFSTINLGVKAFDPTIKDDFSKELVDRSKKIEKNELIFRSENEGFGFFSIYTGPNAVEANEALILLGKIIEGEQVISKIMDVRVDSQYVPLDQIKILDVEVVE